MSNKTAHIAVPTASVIGLRPGNPWEVALFASSKFTTRDGSDNPATVIVGGKTEIGRGQTPLQCGIAEWGQEAGGVKKSGDKPTSRIANPRLALVISDLIRDVRPGKSFAKITDGHCPPEIADITVDAHYGVPDHIIVGDVEGEVSIDGRELLSWDWVDVRELKPGTLIECFGAGHGMVIAAYRAWLEMPEQHRVPVAIGNLDQIAEMLLAHGKLDLRALTAR